MEHDIATIRIGAEYFRNCAKKDYANQLTWVWIREALQNSLDAGATRVDITVTDSTISVKDNGCGMTPDIIRDKLLTLGGSEKAANSTGGFGKAKEILFFAWSQWSIGTSPNGKDSYRIDSNMIGKKPIEHVRTNCNRGTRIEIDFAESGYTRDKWENMTRAFVAYTTTRAKIYLNGRQLTTMEARGAKSEYDFCTVRVNKSKPAKVIIVRINGVPMFLNEIGVNLDATVMVDLKGNSTQILAANRDSLNYIYRYKLDSIISKFVKNPRSAADRIGEKIIFDEYKAKVNKVRGIFHNISRTTENTQLIQKIAAVESNVVSGRNTDELIEEIKEIDPDLGRKLQVIIKGEYESPLGYKFVVRRNNNARPVIDPLSNKAQTILHCWNRVIGELMTKHHPEVEYVVGLTYIPNAKATHVRYNGVSHFLINPVHVPKYGDYLSLGHYIFIEATHEVSHVNNEDHDENFTVEWSKLMENMGVEPRFWKKLFLEAKQEIRAFANDLENEVIEVEA